MTRKYTAFTKAFKLETLALANQPNTCIAQLARDLGLRRNMIYKWRIELNQKQDKAFKRTADTANTSTSQSNTFGVIKAKKKQLEKRPKRALKWR
ncbi:MAG: transposase [Candidatus Thiodubiliella endoseptemdiera]|uniref:Transposase n=1 Tax=Candidatus Thiodubiliella endoseptemdiera TaxID=2738886 RepID=A0A853F079_9GAMM|nr:transposase [Candidatus Thiodubiliella endoseptemdiera]